MKAMLLAALTAGAITIGYLPTASFADSNVRVGVGIGMGDGYGHRWRHRHCHWAPVWRHHHKVMMKVCGPGGAGIHGSVHIN